MIRQIAYAQATAQIQEKFERLYMEAFPEVERKPFDYVQALCAQGVMDMLAFVEGEAFIGLAINMRGKTAALLDYFAIDEGKRGGGYGAKALEMLLKHFEGQTYIFEIETLDDAAPNAEERKRRKAFYLRNGLKETGLFVNTYYTDFELLTPDGQLTFDEYKKVMLEVMGEAVVQTLNPHVISPKA